MRKPLLIGLVSLGLLILSSPPADFAAIVDRIVAVVNGDIITLNDVNARLELLLKNQPTEDEDQINQARREILDQLIERKLVTQEIQTLKLRVEEKEVDEAIERIKQANNVTQEQFEAQLNRLGVDLASFRKDVRDQIGRVKLANRLLRPGIIIPDDQISAYFDQHRDEFQAPGQVFLRDIQLSLPADSSDDEVKAQTQLAERIIKEIRAGLSFVQAARKYSQAQNAGSGGDMGLVKLEEMEPATREAVRGLKEGEISKPIRLSDTLQILQVVETYDTEEKIKRRAKEQIQEILANQELARKYKEWIAEKRAKAAIKVSF
jgi:peptidyl-prolyl cis-trans isomerase SurA